MRGIHQPVAGAEMRASRPWDEAEIDDSPARNRENADGLPRGCREGARTRHVLFVLDKCGGPVGCTGARPDPGLTPRRGRLRSDDTRAAAATGESGALFKRPLLATAERAAFGDIASSSSSEQAHLNAL
ncbi:hypothetical protein ISCGN_001129, partial [Ixodes scapularis]